MEDGEILTDRRRRDWGKYVLTIIAVVIIASAAFVGNRYYQNVQIVREVEVINRQESQMVVHEEPENIFNAEARLEALGSYEVSPQTETSFDASQRLEALGGLN